jgi:hypothetical protein
MTEKTYDRNYHRYRLIFKSINYDSDHADLDPFIVTFEHLEELKAFLEIFPEKASLLGAKNKTLGDESMKNTYSFEKIDDRPELRKLFPEHTHIYDTGWFYFDERQALEVFHKEEHIVKKLEI